MQMNLNLRLEQKQTLIMTPRLQQALNILQLSTLDLKELLQKEAEENPLLEVGEQEETISLDDKGSEELEEIFANTDYAFNREIRNDGEERIEEKILAQPISRDEYLTRQMHLLLPDKVQRRIASFLVGSLDEKGYLAISIHQVARLLGVSTEEVEEVRELLLEQDPPGHGAVNIQEALAHQLAALEAPEKQKEWARKIVGYHWAELTRGKWPSIRRKFKPGPEAFDSGVTLLRSLYPYPSAAYEEQQIRYLEPDIILAWGDNEWRIIMNDAVYPRLRLGGNYQALWKKRDNPEVREFLERKLKGARWLLRCIEQRRVTLYRITEALLELQGDFFSSGKKALKPLALRDVAERLGLHISTICRATTGKYIQTPYGIYELKYFFNSGVESHSSVSIKELIREMVDKEKKQKPLSDQDIANELEEKQDINISRRTVAKYRKQLRVPSSTERKRLL